MSEMKVLVKVFWIFGFNRWGSLRPAEVKTAAGVRYVPLLWGIWVRKNDADDEFREWLAGIQHGIWAHWMRYMFSCGEMDADGNWIMPSEKVERWQRQMNTSYGGLSQGEKESDREMVDRFLFCVKPSPSFFGVKPSPSFFMDSNK